MIPTGWPDCGEAASEDHPTELPATQQVSVTPLQGCMGRPVALSMEDLLARKRKQSLVVRYALIQSV